MLLPQVRAFAEIARAENLSRAAEALFVTQPTLTARLQKLEEELGTPLFVRTNRGMRLTEAGRAFLPYAERALESLAQGRRVVHGIVAGGGQLALGTAPAVSTSVLPQLLKRFTSSYPAVQLSVRTGHSEEILDLVLRDEVQIGLIRALRHPEIESVPFYEDQLLLVVDPNHRFTRSGRIRLEEISAEELIMFDRTSSYHELTSALFREAGVVPRGIIELDNIDAAKKMVQQGLGVALLPHTAVVDELAAESLLAVEIADAPPVRRQIVAIRRRAAGRPTGAAAAFLDLVAEGGPGEL